MTTLIAQTPFADPWYHGFVIGSSVGFSTLYSPWCVFKLASKMRIPMEPSWPAAQIVMTTMQSLVLASFANKEAPLFSGIKAGLIFVSILFAMRFAQRNGDRDIGAFKVGAIFLATFLAYKNISPLMGLCIGTMAVYLLIKPENVQNLELRNEHT